jgi:hypothetical protein
MGMTNPTSFWKICPKCLKIEIEKKIKNSEKILKYFGIMCTKFNH